MVPTLYSIHLSFNLLALNWIQNPYREMCLPQGTLSPFPVINLINTCSIISMLDLKWTMLHSNAQNTNTFLKTSCISLPIYFYDNLTLSSIHFISAKTEFVYDFLFSYEHRQNFTQLIWHPLNWMHRDVQTQFSI